MIVLIINQLTEGNPAAKMEIPMIDDNPALPDNL